MGTIQIKTEIPGPASRALVARRDAAVCNGAAYLTELGIRSGSGSVVEDLDGNRLLDFAGGIGVLGTGHCPVEVTEAIQRQSAELIHMCAIVASYEPMVELAEALNRLAPGDFPKKTMLMNSGAEAVESAVKLARVFTGRSGILVFEGGYHGRTNMTMSMTSKYGLFKKGFGPFAPEVYRIGFPNLLRRPPGMDPEQYIDWSIERLEDALVSHIDPSALGAVVIEPVQGEAGFVPAPPRFLQAIRRLCDEHGVVMIADEVQSGMGRTGRLWAIEHSAVVPDLTVTAKSLGAGMPVGAAVGRAEIMEAAHPGGMGGTYSGNPVAAAAAIATIRTIAEPAFLERATAMGQRMRAGLEAIAARHPTVAEVRGLGPMLAMELVSDEALTPDPDVTLAITKATVARGLITIRAGLYSNCVRFLPPLNTPDDQVDEALAVVAEAFDAVAAEREGAGV